jgi:hypothetical protein
VNNDKYYDPILAYITEHGESGVNTLGNALDISPSTIQKYLDRQTYFKKTEARKWDLPSKVNADIKSDTMTLMVDSVENSLLILRAHLEELVEDVQNSLGPVKTLKRGISTIKAAVAPKTSNTSDIDQRFIDLTNDNKELMSTFKRYINKIPEEYKDLLLNFDHIGFCIIRGTDSINKEIMNEVSELLLEKTDILSEEVITALKRYQK